MKKSKHLLTSLLATLIISTLPQSTAYSQKNPLNQDKKQVLEYKASCLGQEATLKLTIRENTNPITLETKLIYKDLINEEYKSKINQESLSTKTYYYKKKRKGKIKSASFTFYPEKRLVKRTDKKRTYSLLKGDKSSLRDKNKNQIVVDPMALYYYLQKTHPSKLNKKKILCSSGKSSWNYTFEAEKSGRGYKVKATGKKGKNKETDVSFTYYWEKGKIRKISKRIFLIFNLNLNLQESKK